MVIADVARLPLLAAIPALYSVDALSFPLLVALVALTSVCTAAHMPAQRLILAEVVGDEESAVARVERVSRWCPNDCAPRRTGPGRCSDRCHRRRRTCCTSMPRPSVSPTIVVGLLRATDESDGRGQGARAASSVEYIRRSRLLVMLCVSTLTMEIFFTLFMMTLPVFSVFRLRPERPDGRCLLRRDGCGSAARDARRRRGRASVRGTRGRRSGFVLASIPKLLLGIPLPAVAVATVLVLQGFVAPLTGAPIFTVITTRTPAALRAKVLSAAVGLMFLTGPLGPIAAGPLINAVGASMVLAIAAAGYLVGDRAVRHIRRPKPELGRFGRACV